MHAKHVGLAFVLALAATGCRGASKDAGVGKKLAALVMPKEVELPPVLVARLGEDTRRSSELVLGRVADRPVALVMDQDDSAIDELDPVTGAVLSTSKISSPPSEGMLLGDGTLAVVLREESSVAVFARHVKGQHYREVRRVKLPDDPRSLALSPDDKTLYATTGATHTLVALEPLGLGERARTSVAREPRGLVVTDDGESVAIAHATFDGTTLVSTKDLAAKSDKVERAVAVHGTNGICPPVPPESKEENERAECKGELARHAHVVLSTGVEDGSRLLTPLVMVSPRPDLVPRRMSKIAPQQLNKKFMVPSNNSLGMSFMNDGFEVGFEGGGITGYGTSVESGPPEHFELREVRASDHRSTTMVGSRFGRQTKCLVPVAATFASSFGVALVACEGTKRVEVVSEKHSTIASLDVPDSPSAVVVASEGGRVLVWSRLSHTLSAHHLVHSPRAKPVVAMPSPFDSSDGIDSVPAIVAKPTPAPKLATVFTTAVPRAVPREASWLAGRELFAETFDRRISSDGRGCASCHVDGADDALVWSTPQGKRRTRTLEGQLGSGPFGWKGEHKTLAEHVKVTERQLGGTGLPDADREKLTAYVATLGARKRAPAANDGLVAKGRELFVSPKHDCATCHAGGGADTDRAVHDVGSGGTFMTPSLAGVTTRPLLFHDGTYTSLDELLTKSKSMGRANEMSPDERKAMGAFLATL